MIRLGFTDPLSKLTYVLSLDVLSEKLFGMWMSNLDTAHNRTLTD